MSKKIPIYFDSIIASPIEKISNSNPNLGRLKVGVFTKYGNRNGSYITDEVAEQLIRSAIQGNTPVVGFFDPETKDWAGHTGPTLASAYGYVEDFVGWEPLTDTDGVSRDYAIFTVALFTNYFDEAQYIVGQNQSMELDLDSITGDWANIGDIEYFVYTTATIKGLCIIGSHEPCFSVSSFFEKNDEQYKSQNEKFSSLLFELKQQIEEAEKNAKGGEQPMNEFENQEGMENTPELNEQEPAAAKFEAPEAETAPEQTPETEFDAQENAPEAAPVEEPAEPSEFEVLQGQFNDLQTSFNNLTEQFNAQTETINTLNNEIDSLRAENATLQANITTYEAERTRLENDRKTQLVDKYAALISEEEIEPIRAEITNYSYEQLESKLAISYANKQMAGSEVEKVPLPQPQVNSFALLMEKYHK